MKLRKLIIDRLPGIDRSFELNQLGDGLNLIVGPNGIGKSRLCAVVRALLWRERSIKGGGLSASAVFEHQNETWRVERDGSRYGWQRDGIDEDPPSLPGARLDACFFLGLRDLLDNSDHAGQDLASEIRKQMSGGFDLDIIARRFEKEVPAKIGTKESKALSAAENEIRHAERSQIAIERQEQELESLELGAEKAKSALRRLPYYDQTLSLLEMRHDHELVQIELAELPAALANLDGKEIERLDATEEDLNQKRSDREDAKSAVEESRATINVTRLSEPVDPALLDTWHQRASNIGELERRLTQAKENAAAAHEAANECQKALGSHSDSSVPLTIDDDLDLFAFLRESQQLNAEHMTITERLNLLAAGEFSDDDVRRLELLKRGVEPLREWLRSPDPSDFTNTVTLWPSRTHYFIAAIVFFVIGFAALFLLPSFPFSIITVGLGVGLALAGVLSRLVQVENRDAPHRRSAAQQRFPAAIDAPTSWSIEGVTEYLYQLEDELVKLDTKQNDSRSRATDQTQLKQKMNNLDERGDDLKVRRQELANRLGLDTALRPDADMVDTARAFDAVREARVSARSADARVTQLEGQLKDLLGSITAFLTDLHEQNPLDAASARAGIDSLKERNRTLQGAQTDANREQKRCIRLDRDIQKLEVAKSSLFRASGIEANDRPTLIRHLDSLGRYRELCRKRDDLSINIKRASEELTAVGEAPLTELDIPQLNDEKAVLEEKSQHLDSLNRQIGEINQSARSAREGHVLEDAITSTTAALVELGDRRDEAFAAAAGKFLIDRVRIDHETNQMPRVLERAQRHFATFTHDRYWLNVSSHDGGSFVAIDAKKGSVGLRPDQLSDGTRGQLILAVRLAFAEEVEQGADLPLFLDEALDHSDPERFHTIARSIARMVEDDGRQVFYLSNDATDLERFRSAFDAEGCDALMTIDLGEILDQATRVDSPETFRVTPLAPVPSPDGETAESYGAAIGVAPLDPNHDPISQHLYYVLREDLPLLHDLLLARIETVGQYLNLLKRDSPRASEFTSGREIGAQLEARIALLETFCLTWREGRGKKVDRLDLEQSDAISNKYLDSVVAVAGEFDGDPEQLLAALRERKDPRLRGYRSKAVEELENFFVKQGHLDYRPILDENQLLARAIDTPAASQLSSMLAAELLHQWWSLSLQTSGA